MTDPRLLPEALRLLTGEGRARSPQQLLDALHDRFRSAGREKLADLVYEMVRACLAAFPDYADRGYQEVPARAPEVISGELTTMNKGLAGLSAEEDLSAVRRTRPEADRALRDTETCLDVLRQLEGDTPRHALARALHLVHADEPSLAEPILRALLDQDGCPAATRWYVTVNLAFCLHRQHRSAEALPLARAAMDQRPEIPTPAFNLVSCAADVGDREAFEAGLRHLAAIRRRDPSPVIARWVDVECGELARQMDVHPDDVRRLAGMADSGTDTAG